MQYNKVVDIAIKRYEQENLGGLWTGLPESEKRDRITAVDKEFNDEKRNAPEPHREEGKS